MAHPKIKLFLNDEEMNDVVEGLKETSEHCSSKRKRTRRNWSDQIHQLTLLSKQRLCDDEDNELDWSETSEFSTSDIFGDIAQEVIQLFDPEDLKHLMKEKICI